MDIEKLRASYEQNSAMKAICDHMDTRLRNQSETKLRRMIDILSRSGYDFRRAEVISAFRVLEEAGCGKYIEGRHGLPSRFAW